VAAVTSVSDEKWRPFKCFFSQVGLRTYHHACSNCSCSCLISTFSSAL